MAKQVPRKLTPLETLEDAAECLKTVAHPYRLRIIQMLLAGDYMVSELAEACDIQPHMASEHLRLMQRAGLLASRRDGRKIFYSVAEPHLEDIIRCIEARYS
ncbi:metalloregulator ArsR/SmtB family transcription factor [Aeoliella sp. ICT_H6.2]|uniref:Metalloregulator ArsR/SmtB family transcription factor n=1 Tax=Aeoliella straminimaris TaxID=2954799 RepID=A0A9X2JI96_9BACT|nr:metalloregulator ArsR/SmtB family transcription factor [Aeoliella straminimaris]MCO6046631.1 metalloregulator ArsR/SmtB family transcription factor [Aeoliella straminimaris]